MLTNYIHMNFIISIYKENYKRKYFNILYNLNHKYLSIYWIVGIVWKKVVWNLCQPV